jgi:hypothetical protein
VTNFTFVPYLEEHYGDFTIMIKLYDNDRKKDVKTAFYVIGVVVHPPKEVE